jgi:hypothetical protein
MATARGMELQSTYLEVYQSFQLVVTSFDLIYTSGWCTYYTCLKRLSTFFTIVAVGSDYCVWMTGSPPSAVRFHLLNAGEDSAIKICMWFKSTQRKDIYKVIQNGNFPT